MEPTKLKSSNIVLKSKNEVKTIQNNRMRQKNQIVKLIFHKSNMHVTLENEHQIDLLLYTPYFPSNKFCYLFYCFIFARNCNDLGPPLVNIIFFGLFFRGSPQGFKTLMLEEGFHTLSSPPINVEHHNSHHNSPPLGPNVLIGTLPRVYPSSGNCEKAGTTSVVWL